MHSLEYNSSLKFTKKKGLFQLNSCKKKGSCWGGKWTWEKADRSYEDINIENVPHRNNPKISASWSYLRKESAAIHCFIFKITWARICRRLWTLRHRFQESIPNEKLILTSTWDMGTSISTYFLIDSRNRFFTP